MIQSIIDKFKVYIGYGNCLGQKDLDQGDGSQRDGHFFSLAKLLNAPKDFMGRDLSIGYNVTMMQHEAAPGLYRRSPNPSYWGHNPNNFSRDQHSIMKTAMAIMGDKKRLKEAFYALIKRCGFHQNYHIGTDVPAEKPWSVKIMIKVYKFFTGKDTDYWKVPDIMTPNEVSTFIRGMNYWLLYPVLVVLDFLFILDLQFRKTHLWDADNMIALHLLYANHKFVTPFSKLAMKLYLKTDFMDRIKNYYDASGDKNGLQPMGDLFEMAYRELQKE